MAAAATVVDGDCLNAANLLTEMIYCGWWIAADESIDDSA